MRLLPDLLRLLKRLAVDPRCRDESNPDWIVPAACLCRTPIEMIPDVIPVIGFADDAIIIGLVLRWISRTAGRDALAKHWPGTPDGLATLLRLCGLAHPAVE